MYFGMAGIDLSVSATIVSIMNLGSALFSLFSGKVLGTLKTKGFHTFWYVSFIVDDHINYFGL